MGDYFLASVISWVCATIGLILMMKVQGASDGFAYAATVAFVWVLIGLLPFGLAWSKKTAVGLIVFAGVGSISCSIFLLCLWNFMLSALGAAGGMHPHSNVVAAFGALSGGAAAFAFGLVRGFLAPR